MNYLTSLLLLVTGITIGLNLPDLDYKVSFLVHRSLMTHGFLLPLILFWATHLEKSPLTRLLSMGFSLASATHLCFDLLPRAWIGFALIYIPLYGRTSPLFSWLWIAVGIIVCLYLTFALIKNLADAVTVIGSLLATFGWYATTEAVFWPALVALVLATIIAFILPSDSTEIIKKLILEKNLFKCH